MADLFSAIKEFVEFGFKIKSVLETAGDNTKGCRRIDDLLGMLSAIAKHLQGSPNIMEDDSMRDTVEGLRKALQRASEFVAKYEGKGFLSRAFNANDIAEKLRGVCLDVLLNMSAVLLANGALNNSVLVNVKENGDQLRENVDQLRADVTHNNSMLDKILLIVTAQRDVHLQEEMAKLVKDYQISSQTKNERETKKTGVASSQNKNKRDAKETDVARREVKIQKANKLSSTVVPQDGLAESASAASVVGQYDDSSTITNKASSSISKLVDEAQSVGVSAAPFHPQKIVSISEEPGETGRYKIISRSIENMTSVTSIDAHPTKAWILTGHEGGNFSIWDYQKQKTVELQVNEVPDKAELKWHGWFQYVKETPLKHSVFSAKFIGKGKRLVVGDGHGYIYVYDYIDTKLHEVKKFKAHNKSVNSLAAHPTKPYLLSSSAFSNNIKVWDWNNDWKQIQNFDVEPEIKYYAGVRSVKFNPRDTDSFACVTFDNRVKVWNPKTSSLETTLKGPFVEADYLFTSSHQHLMVTLRSNSHNSEIWDLKTGKVAHTLSVSGRKTTRVACHPKLPILVTTLDDGTVCLWDASTYRLEKKVHITDSECRDLVFLPDTNGLTRLAVAFERTVAIMEVNLPIASTSNASG